MQVLSSDTRLPANAPRSTSCGGPAAVPFGILKLPPRVCVRRGYGKLRPGGRAILQLNPCRAATGDPGALHYSSVPPSDGEAQVPNSVVGERSTMHSQAEFSGRGVSNDSRSYVAVAPLPTAAPVPSGKRGPGAFNGRDYRFLLLGGVLAVVMNVFLAWASHLPLWQRIVRRFIWWGSKAPPSDPYGTYTGLPDNQTTAMVLYGDNSETVEWINMCWRKAWRVYQRGLERWLADLLQPVFDNLVAEKAVPHFVQRLRILEFSLDHEAPYFSNMRRRQSRKDSDLNGVVDVRYTGRARMLLLLVVGQGRWKVKIPVLVSDLDLETRMWIKVRLAPMCPFVGTISLAFVGPPNIKVQLLPYNRVRLMRIPILQAFLTKLLTIDLPGLMVLPKRLEINIPPAVTAVAEAAVGRDAVMRAVASAVLQADALETALIAALPLGPQSAAGGMTLPTHFNGELTVKLKEARALPVWGFPWQSNPYCRLTLGGQAVRGRKDDQTSHAGSHRAPVWNQEFQFLVEDPKTQFLTISIRDSHITGRPDVGYVKFALSRMPADGMMDIWLPVQAPFTGEVGQGELNLQLVYKPFEDDEEEDPSYAEAEEFVKVQEPFITDVKSAADASARANAAASSAAAAVAVTKAAAARAALKMAARQRMAALSVARRQAAEAAMDAEALEAATSDVGTPSGNGTGNGVAPGPGRDENKDGAHAPSGSKQAHLDTDPAVALKALADSVDPDDLFPGWDFRVNDFDDEDIPYPFRERAKKRRPKKSRSESAARQNGSTATSSDIGKRAGHDEEAPSVVRASAVLETASATGHGGDGFHAIENGAAEAPAMDDSRNPDTQMVSGANGRARAQGANTGLGTLESTLEEAEDAVDVEAVALPAGAMNALTKHVGLQTREPEVKHLHGERKPLYYGHADENISDMIVADTAADIRRGEGIAGWWGATKDTVSGWVGGAVGGVVNWWTERNNEFGEDPLDKKRRMEEERRAKDRQEGREPLENVIVPPDLPLDAIAEEVKDAWRLKEVHVESLLKKAVEKSERPWLMFLGTMTIVCVVMLALVFWRLESLM